MRECFFECASLYLLIALALAMMLASAGWLLFVSAPWWIPATYLLCRAVFLSTCRVPAEAARVEVRILTALLLICALIRHDSDDAGGYTGMSVLFSQLGCRSSSYVEGWQFLQFIHVYYLLLMVRSSQLVKAMKLQA